MIQGTTPTIAIKIDGYFPWSEIDILEVAIADHDTKIYISKDQCTWDAQNKRLLISLTQTQTFSLSGRIAVQLRYRENTGRVYGSNIAPLSINASISDKLLGTDTALTPSSLPVLSSSLSVQDTSPVSIEVEVISSGGIQYDDTLEATPNYQIGSVEVGVKKTQSIKNWIKQIITKVYPPSITLSTSSVTYTIGEALTAGTLTVTATGSKGTGTADVEKMQLDSNTAVSGTTLTYSYPSENIPSGTAPNGESHTFKAIAEDGGTASATLNIYWKYKIAHKKYDAAFTEITDGSSLTITMGNGAGSFYVSVPASRTAPYAMDGPVKYDADGVVNETRHNIQYKVYRFDHKVSKSITYTIKY